MNLVFAMVEYHSSDFMGPNVELSGLPEAGPLERRVGLVKYAAKQAT